MRLIETINGTSIWQDGSEFKVYGSNTSSAPVVCRSLAEARIVAAHDASPRRTLRRKAIARRRRTRSKFMIFAGTVAAAATAATILIKIGSCDDCWPIPCDHNGPVMRWRLAAS